MSAPDRVCLVSASRQNVFFAEILEALGAGLSAHGFEVERSVDCFPPPADDLVYLFIPHEFQPLVDPLAHPSPTQLRRSVAVCTEQPGTDWFEVACGIAAQTGSTVDISEVGVEALRERGIAAEHAPLGYVRAWDRWRRTERDRSIDLAFLGGHTDRREHALARCAPALAGRRTAIHMTETGTPHAAGSHYFLSHERKWDLMADSKTIVNIHRGELPYLEWHRVLGAILNGCVVLTEHSIGADPLVPGEHFVSADYDDLPFVLDGLLDDRDRLERIRTAAYDLVRERMPPARMVEGLTCALERAAAGSLPSPARNAPPPAPLPHPVPVRPPDWEASLDFEAESTRTRTALKHLVVKVHDLERRMEDFLRGEPTAEDRVETFGARTTPRVSVLLTVYNYADHIAEALRSVALSEMRDLEAIVVDDGSSDGSPEAVRRAAGELSWLPITLVRRSRNHGLPAARNTALAHARGELVFILDADNTVLPSGIGTLARALYERPDAAFAYGLLERFDASGPVGLLNWVEWDTGRLRHGNYIDAMAMIRRSALEAIGGYPMEKALYGWEDFAVWIAMACEGMHGVRVPEFVARYRETPHSMLSLTSVDTSAAWAMLLRKHPSLALLEETGERAPAQT